MKNKGFTLIEVLLSVFIITVAILALYNSVNYSYNSIKKAKDKFIASYLAEEGVELVKNIRDSNFVEKKGWKEGLIGTPNCNNLSGYGCRMDFDDDNLIQNNSEEEMKKFLCIDELGEYNYNVGGSPTIFSRKIIIRPIKEDKIKVEVVVYYGEEEFLLERYLYNWK